MEWSVPMRFRTAVSWPSSVMNVSVATSGTSAMSELRYSSSSNACTLPGEALLRYKGRMHACMAGGHPAWGAPYACEKALATASGTRLFQGGAVAGRRGVTRARNAEPLCAAPSTHLIIFHVPLPPACS